MVSKSPASYRRRGNRQSKIQNTRNRQMEDTPHWGDKIRSKHQHMVRICFGNVNNIGQNKTSYKTLQLQEVIENKDIDLMCMAETGVHWKSIPAEHNLWERTHGWFEDRRISTAYNIHDPLARRSQYGGTAMIAINSLVAKINTCGYDPSGLGRWTWMLMRGRRGTTTRVITAYCPCKVHITGPSNQRTVYAQHLRHSSREPITAFWEDLGQALDTWTQDEEQIIICGDWNHPINSTFLKTYMGERGLKEAIHHRHGTNSPPTYIRGTNSIDGIFVSPNFLGVKGGYLEFGTTPGDHRGIWIDVPQSTFMGYKMPDIPTNPIRRLQVKDPKSRNKYQSLTHSWFLKKNIYGRILHIRDTATTNPSTTWSQQYNKIDSDMEKYMLLAASKSRRVRVGGKQFSDKLQQARRTILLWNLVKQRHLGCKVNARTIIRARKKAQITNSNVTLEEAESNLNSAYKNYKIISRQDGKHRRAFREKLARDKAAEGNHTAATMLRQMDLHEQQRRDSRRVKATLKKNSRCGTTRIQVIEGSVTKDITKKAEMERLIIAENEKKYHQTERSCPLLQGQLLQDIGLLGDGPAVPDILNGTYTPPPSSTKAVKLWLKNLHIPKRDDREAVLSTLKEYRHGWKLVREHTASGELHFGHYQACARHDMLSWAIFVMSGLPRAIGFTPERWRRCTDVMLLKKEGFFLLDKLRTIVLYESDFNHENKRLGREAINLAIDKNLIAEEQYSRPGRSAQDNALNKRLMFDHHRMTREPFGICACDLKSCYDRIVHNAASLALQRVGVRQTDIKSMFGTIQRMIHKVRTAFGDSQDTYHADNPEYLLPVQGTGQGNGAGPSIWSILCSTIFEILHKEGYSSRFCYALSRGVYEICGFAYVDDCDLFYLGNDADEIFDGLSSMLRLWDELMEVTGAAIAPDKCWWYLIEFTWHRGRWSYSDQGHQFILQVRNKNGETENIKYLTSDIAQEMLGIYLSPDGNHRIQFKTMRDKAIEWGQHIKQGSLTTEVTWNAMNTTILKSLEYPLAATTFSEEELGSILAPALQSGLPSSGLCRTFPRAILYGPPHTQGLGTHNLYHTQGIRHIKDILDQSWRNTPSAKLLIANIESMKIDAGIGGYLFQQDTPLSWLTTKDTIVSNTLDFCQRYEITFQEPGTNLQLKRENDAFLMEGFIAAGATTTELQAINRCRLYLRVTTVSDISTGDGQRLSQTAYERKTYTYRDTYHWPQQGRPPPTDWKIWDYFVKQELGKFHTYPNPLGTWLLPQDTFIQGWDYFITTSSDLVEHKEEKWIYHSPLTQSRSRHLRYDLTKPRRISNTPPRTRIFRTTIHRLRDIATTEGYAINNEQAQILPSIPLNKSEAFMTYLHQHPDSAWIAPEVHGLQNIQDIIDGFIQGSLAGISDGSFHKEWQTSSAAWSMVNTTTEKAICGGGIIPGPPKAQDAYRGETGGLHGLLLVVLSLETLTNTRSKSITIACDGRSALLKTLHTYKDKFSSSDKCFDLISRTIDIRDSIQSTLQPTHVKGHQEEYSNTLTLLEDWNVQMDGLAKRYILDAHHQNFQAPHSLPDADIGIANIKSHNEPITSQLSTELRTVVAGQDATEWWLKKERISEDTVPLIDWTVSQAVMTESTKRQQKFISKWVTNQLPVGSVQFIRKLQSTPACPRCGFEYEDNRHIVECPHHGARHIWNSSMRKFDIWLRRIGTDPNIVRAFSLSLHRWHSMFIDETYCPSLVSPQVRTAMQEQGQITWDNFVTGLWSKKWAEIQDVYYKTKKKRNTGRRWAIKVSTHLWNILKSLWDHRNSILYRHPSGSLTNGREELLAACQTELDIGLHSLEDIYSLYFDTDIDTLETMKTYDLKLWFATIRRAREAINHTYRPEEKISDSLRRWTGLQKQPNQRQS